MNFKQIESKWQKKWADSGIFNVDEKGKNKYYVLEMFPYPSGAGLHMGHAFNYTIGDAFARLKRMQGFNVLYPMGYDSLGLPAENAAIKAGTHPMDYTEKSVKNFIIQHKSLGLSYDWTRVLSTHDPKYYKWDQWIFLQMFKKGLAYRKKAPVNWCPECKTALANEQVHNGKCWRHENTNIEVKPLEQWFFKTTEYADELYENIDKLENWPEDVKAMQKHWIGKSHGTEINFEINGKVWPVFTTRPDTIYGVTFTVVAAQHPNLMDIVTDKQKGEVEKFLKKIKSTSEKDMEDLEKDGVFTGAYAINPITNEEVPVYAGNFVVADYGSGMVMAVPAHDQRDFEFAKKYKIPIKIVISSDGKETELKRSFTGEGIMINSNTFDGKNNVDAKKEIINYIVKSKVGKKTIQFRLKDWLLSRQRYWGTPIPIIYCNNCGIVPDENLPVELPKDVKFGKGNPLLTSESFVNVKCPKCGGEGRRETDTMDTFVNSSWYFLRYCDPTNDTKPFDPKKANYWCPVDFYIGGREHACMHLIYFRFYTKFLRDLGLLKFDEPAIRVFNQGLLHAADGRKMSKSLGNVIDPLEMIEKYGADTLRTYLVSTIGPDKDFSWSDKGLLGIHKFINKFISLTKLKYEKDKTKDKFILSKTESTMKNVIHNIENLKYNLAIRDLQELVNYISRYSENISKDTFDKSYKKLILMSSPFMPHVCEELWEKLGNKNFVSLEKIPKVNEKLINLKVETAEEVVSQVIRDVEEIKKLVKIKPSKVKIFVSAPWKYDVHNLLVEGKTLKDIMKEDKYKRIGKELVNYIQKLEKRKPLDELFLSSTSEKNALDSSKDFLENQMGVKVEILSTSDEPKAKSAEPGKPGILIE